MLADCREPIPRAPRRRIPDGRLIGLKPVMQTSEAGHPNDTTKHIFVTGGVVSSLGKGLTAASLGNLLTARGLRVVMQKLDPYLNVAPGTMNPFQNAEVFVTKEGAETAIQLGTYNRLPQPNRNQTTKAK